METAKPLGNIVDIKLLVINEMEKDVNQKDLKTYQTMETDMQNSKNTDEYQEYEKLNKCLD